jgi:hypothetical protein
MLAGLGAFLSGAGSVLGAIFVIRGMRKRMRADCEERLELFRQGINVGAKIEEK